jgi:hypothetical protein
MRFDLQDGDRFACQFDRFFNLGDISLKLATPICLVSPACFILHSEAIDSESGTCAFGQWIINKSTHGSAKRSRLSSTERSKSQEAKRVNQTLVVRKISSRLSAEPRMPEPTSRSLQYICAVSRCR